MTRTVETRFKILRNGADFGELIADENDTPLLRMNDEGEIKTSLSGSFLIPQEINWLQDEIRPELWIDGQPFPLGVYLPATVRESESETTKSVTIDCYDRAWRVRDNYTESLIYFAAGTSYITAVEQLLIAAGIRVIVATPSSATLTEAREDWEIGTSYLTIVNQLLTEINYNPLWFNSQGAAILEPATTPTAEYIDHTLDADSVRSLLLPQIERETDVYQTPNVFICVCSNADKDAALVAVAENNNPQSPLSIPRRGRRICSFENVDNIASLAELQAYAERLRDQTQFSGETITVQTALLPGYGVADVTALHYGDLSAICIERGWTMELRTGGTMSHRLERVVLALG